MGSARQIIESDTLQEVHWSEVWPKGFHQLIKEWKGKHTYGLYIQFTNEPTGDTSHKAAFQTPSHSDPIGVYAYPMEYVIKHPADIWYGHGTSRARVLRDKSKNLTRLDTMSWNDAERLLWRANLSHLIKPAKRAYPDRAKGVTAPGKIFMSCIQMDLDKGPTGENWGKKKYDVRTGAEQTKLLRKCGVDALLDKASRHSQASINDREPWQIVFLTPQAFEVVTTYRLSDPRAAGHTDATARNRIDKLQRKLAAGLCDAMGDRLSGEHDSTGLAGWTRWWTKDGRVIETLDEDTSLNARFAANVHKPHRMSTKSTPHKIAIVVKSERGEWKGWMWPDEKSGKILTEFNSCWASNAGKDSGKKYSKEQAKEEHDREQLISIVSKEGGSELSELRFAEYRRLLAAHPDWTVKQYDAAVDNNVGTPTEEEYETAAQQVAQQHPGVKGSAYARLVGDEVLRLMRQRSSTRQIIESETLQHPAHEWYVLTSGSPMTCGQHSFRDGDREVPAADPIDAEWFDYRDVDLKSHEDVLAGQRCALLYASRSASSYHTRFGDWVILVDLQPADAQSMKLERWERYDGSQDLKKASLGQRGGLDMYEEFAYTNEDDLNNILRSRKHLPGHVERADGFRRPGETSEEWWERRVNIATSDDWMRKKDGD